MKWSDQYKHPNWQRKRLEALECAYFSCEKCGDGDSQLHVHHKRYVKGRAIWEYSTNELSVLCEACHERAHVVKDLTQELLARIHCCADSEILAILASYMNGIQGPAHADTDDILKFAEDPFAESVGALAALASNRLDIYAIRGLCEQLSTAEDGGSITFTIPVKKRPLFGGMDL